MPSIARLDLFHIAVPLKKPIRHASHERASSDSIVARITLDDGSIGFGEGVPRDYVTGETIDSAMTELAAFEVAPWIGRPADFAALVERLKTMTLPSIARDPRGMHGNAARSALELALIDAYGRSFGASATDAIRLSSNRPDLLEPTPRRVRYSSAITAETPRNEVKSAIKMRLYGFHQVKLKVGVAGQDDPARLRKIRAILGRKVDIRIDANEAWTPETLIERVDPLLASRPSALEQPLPHAEVAVLAALRPRLGVPVMLDESLCGYPDGLRAIEDGTADIFNVRISKCGGLIPTLRLVELAYENGLAVQLGCHPGETGLLSAAGRHFASVVKGLRYVEGSYDRHVLSRNLTRDDPTFGYGGWARPISGPGLGVAVDPDALAAMTVTHREVRHD